MICYATSRFDTDRSYVIRVAVVIGTATSMTQKVKPIALYGTIDVYTAIV